MRTGITQTFLSLTIAMLLVTMASGQGGPRRKNRKEERPARPRDPRLVEMHREFLSKTEKLAAEYESKRDLTKAREVYESILRLMPKYEKAEQALSRITQQEATKDRKTLKVSATRDWQDAGVVLQKGMPVHIEAQGEWETTMKTGPDGLQIPKEYRNFKLGALVGIINTGGDPKEIKPFLIGSKKDFIAEQTGRLFLRIYDANPRDNAGDLSVLIQSTFTK
jgi:hypothetical protein